MLLDTVTTLSNSTAWSSGQFLSLVNFNHTVYQVLVYCWVIREGVQGQKQACLIVELSAHQTFNLNITLTTQNNTCCKNCINVFYFTVHVILSNLTTKAIPSVTLALAIIKLSMKGNEIGFNTLTGINGSSDLKHWLQFLSKQENLGHSIQE